MKILQHELRQGRLSWIIWTAILTVTMVLNVLLYPLMDSTFSELGAMEGMEDLDLSSLVFDYSQYYASQCEGNLGLGGVLFAALLAAGMLAKEERNRTAEFLFSHPVSRVRVVLEKAAAVLAQIVLLNAAIFLCSVGATAIIGQAVPWKAMGLIHLTAMLGQIHIAGICLLLSAFVRKGSAGIGLGVALGMYLIYFISLITEKNEFLQFITPFGYMSSMKIVSDGAPDWIKIAVGMNVCALCVAGACMKYRKKDLN